jgi:hypothetical protein
MLNWRKLLRDTIFFAPGRVGLYSVFAMNKRSVQKRPAKASRNQVVRKAAPRRISGKSAAIKRVSPAKAVQPPTPVNAPIIPAAVPIRAVAPAPMASPAKTITMPGPALRTHRFRVGETVLYTSSPITRPGASGTYKVVKLLPSDGDDYQYRIKNSDEAFERVAKESQLETEFSEH